MGYNWAQHPIFQLTASRYTFVQFITALNESLQLQDKISRSRAPEILYVKYMTDARDVRKHPNQVDEPRRWDHRRNQSSSFHRRNSGPWNRRYDRQRSRSPAYEDGPRRNPSTGNKRVCWGCESTDHILSDRKCTPTLENIRTNIVSCFQYLYEDAHMLAEEFATLFVKPNEREPNSTHIQAPMCSPNDTHLR